MAVVTTTFATTANQNWITSTGWVATDPSFRVNTQLTNWVNAINNTSIIEIVRTPNDATLRSGTNRVRWLLRCREGDTANGDYGLIFHERYADSSGASSSWNPNYNNRIADTSNNGYGTFNNSYTYSASIEPFTSAGNAFIAYEAVGTTPWFVYSWENAAKTSRWYRFLLRLDTSNAIAGSYYPPGVSKWIYCEDTAANLTIHTSQSNNAAPYRGVIEDGWALRHPYPTTSTNYGDNYFFKLTSQYGAAHYLGQPTGDILVSNSNTGVWGDTTTIDGVTYTCLREYWVKSS